MHEHSKLEAGRQVIDKNKKALDGGVEGIERGQLGSLLSYFNDGE